MDQDQTTPIPSPAQRLTDIEARLERRLVRPDGLDGCWLWTGTKRAGGHGYICLGKSGVNGLTHRVSYTIHVGPIPAGAQVLHRCDTPSCCNPAHLYLGDHVANMRDKAERGRALRGERCNLSRLNEETVREIRRVRGAERLSHRALGRRFGVHPTTVHSILSGETWKHL